MKALLQCLDLLLLMLSGCFFDKSLAVTAPNVPSICHHHQTRDKPLLDAIKNQNFSLHIQPKT